MIGGPADARAGFQDVDRGDNFTYAPRRGIRRMPKKEVENPLEVIFYPRRDDYARHFGVFGPLTLAPPALACNQDFISCQSIPVPEASSS